MTAARTPIIFTHLVQVIGEAAARVSLETRDVHPEVPWKKIIGMRHRLVHVYLQVGPGHSLDCDH